MATPEVERARDLAIADALAGLGKVATTLSARLYEIHTADQARPQLDAPPVRLGERQRRVLALTGWDNERGLGVSEVATALGFERPNTHNLLVRLEKMELLERLEGHRPMRWRRAA